MIQQSETEDIKKKILSTGIRVGTQVKTKFMKPFITKASPEGLYMIDLDLTLERIKIAAKFINRIDVKKVIVCSGSDPPHRRLIIIIRLAPDRISQKALRERADELLRLIEQQTPQARKALSRDSVRHGPHGVDRPARLGNCPPSPDGVVVLQHETRWID